MVWVKVLGLLFLVAGIGCDSKNGAASSEPIEVIEVSKLRDDPTRGPYPNGASVCLCRNSEGDKILVAIPAFRDRKILPFFEALKPGATIRGRLTLWPDRPPEAKAMFFANRFADEFELKLFYAESVSANQEKDKVQLRPLAN